METAGSDEKKSKKQMKKEAKLAAKATFKEQKELEKSKQDQNQVEGDYSASQYGICPLNIGKYIKNVKFYEIKDLSKDLVDKAVWVQGRLHTSRAKGKQCFIVLREERDTVQCLAFVGSAVSKPMVKFISGITKESVLNLYGIVKAVEEPIEACTHSNLELHILQTWVVSVAKSPLPLQIEDASRRVTPEELKDPDRLTITANQDTRLDNRVIDLRTLANQAIFRLESLVCYHLRNVLHDLEFTEIHTPKIINAASEGGANVFTINYFKGSAYLAQSPQFYKQMAVAGGFNKVYTVGSVFRAEDSNTHRHLTEFIGFDLEVVFKVDYHEVLTIIENMFVELFKRLKNAKEIQEISQQYPVSEFLFTESVLRLKFSEGIKLLREHGVTIGDHEDLSTANEKHLGRLVREKYHTDFYVLDKYPLAIRPFYTMPDNNDEHLSNSYDMFMRGEEIMSGAQRIHDADLLTKRAQIHGIDLEKIKSYIDAFKYGCPPHAGGGVGLERVVMLYLGLDNIRKTSMFPRDPKRLTP